MLCFGEGRFFQCRKSESLQLLLSNTMIDPISHAFTLTTPLQTPKLTNQHPALPRHIRAFPLLPILIRPTYPSSIYPSIHQSYPKTTSLKPLSLFPPTAFSSTQLTGPPNNAPRTQNPVAKNCQTTSPNQAMRKTLKNLKNSVVW